MFLATFHRSSEYAKITRCWITSCLPEIHSRCVLASYNCVSRWQRVRRLEFVRILSAADDETFTSDFVTRCSGHHIQRYVKRFDDDRFKHVLSPLLLIKPVSAAVAPNNRQNVHKGEMMKRQYVRIVRALVGFPQIARAGTQCSFLVNG